MTAALWKSSTGTSLERAAWSPMDDGHRLAGTTLLLVEGEAYELRWSVITGQDGMTRTVGVHVQGPDSDRRLALGSDGTGTWFAGDQPLLDLYGATDVDLSWTPATNSLPIRRLDLGVGDSAEVTTVLVDFPAHDIVRRTQHYTRTAEDTYRYRSGDVDVDLIVGADGWVSAYPDGWNRIDSPRS